MKFLHSADWHLGSTLHECRRTEQFGKMLDGMRRVIEEESVDVLLLSGDVFDTAGPPVSAQKQYYSFLASLRESGCRGAVVIAGNHDSPALLGASSAILDRLAIHVVSRPGEEENAIIPLGEALVIAVPYLRESDVDSYISGATAEEQRQSFVAHVTSLLSHLSDEAERRYPGVPQIVMSHSFISGSAIYVADLNAVSVGDSVFGGCDFACVNPGVTGSDAVGFTWF